MLSCASYLRIALEYVSNGRNSGGGISLHFWLKKVNKIFNTGTEAYSYVLLPKGNV